MPRGRLTILPKFWQNAKFSSVSSRRTDAAIIVADNVTRDPSAYTENASMLDTWGQRVNHFRANRWLATSVCVCWRSRRRAGAALVRAPSRRRSGPYRTDRGRPGIWSFRAERTQFYWPLGVVTYISVQIDGLDADDRTWSVTVTGLAASAPSDEFESERIQAYADRGAHVDSPPALGRHRATRALS